MARRRRHSKVRTVIRHVKSKTKAGFTLGGKKAINYIVGSALLAGARRIPDFAGPYQGAVDKIIVGGGTKLAGLSGQADMLSVGIKEGLADLIDLELVPRLGGVLATATGSKNPGSNPGHKGIMNVRAI